MKESTGVLALGAMLVVSRCGERYYDRATMQHIERVREHIQDDDAVLREVGKVLVCDR